MSTFHTFRQVRKSSGRFFSLFFVLISVVLLAPFLGAGTEAPPLVLDLLYAAIPMAALFAVRRSKALLAVGLIVAVPAVIAALQGRFDGTIFPPPWGAVVGGIFYAFVCSAIVRYLSTYHDEVTADTVFGVMSLYLLVGIIFTNVYVILEEVHPGSLYVSEAQNPDGILQPIEMLYFSFVTLTTLGYGDITPVTAQARSVAIIEAIFGVLFMAVVLGRVVGIYTAKRGDDYADG